MIYRITITTSDGRQPVNTTINDEEEAMTNQSLARLITQVAMAIDPATVRRITQVAMAFDSTTVREVANEDEEENV